MKQHSSSYLFLFLTAALLCLSLVGCSVNNGDGGGGVSPPSTIYPQSYAQPSVSSDGSKMLFVRNKVTRINKGGGFSIAPDSSGIWVADNDGRNMKLLIQSQNVGSPSFSPDMQWMLFEGGGHIYKVPFTRGSVVMDSLLQLTNEGRNFFPTWSPNGQWIAYDSNVDSSTGLNFVWKMKADGSEKERIAYTPDEGETRMPSWSMEGNKIVHIRFLVGVFSSEIYTMNADGSAPVRLTNNGDTDRYPNYTMDGQKISFHSDLQVWVMQADGSNSKRIHKKGTQPAWDTDGKIVFVDFDPHRFSKDNGTIWMMNADGSNKQQLTFNHGLELEQ